MKTLPPVEWTLASLLCFTLTLPLCGAQVSKEKQKAKNKALLQEPAAPSHQAPQPVISFLFPAGGQRGKTVEITASGTNLVRAIDSEAIDSVRVSGSGVSARIVQATNHNVVRVALTISPDAALGERELRFITRGGASNRARFIVGSLPELTENEPNSIPSEAQRIESLPVVLNGQIQQQDRDCFRFHANKGEKLVIAAQARVLTPYIADAVPGWLDAVLTLRDANGRKLAADDDFEFSPDPVIFFTVPADGDYIIEVADIIHRGRGDFVYRLTVGAVPYLTHIFPLGGRCGEEAQLKLSGVNLPNDTVKISLSSATLRKWIHVNRESLESNPLPLAVGNLPGFTETEPNNAFTNANAVQTPVAINGRIQQAGDSDWFSFPAKAGDKLVMEVLARRLNSPLDSVLTLFNASGRELAENDDNVDPAESLVTHHADSWLQYTFTAAGTYALRIRDAQGKCGDEFAYRLVIAPPQPDFALRVTPDNPRVGQGDSTVLTVNALRKDGFNGEIDLKVENLPAGFVVRGGLMAANRNEVKLTVTAPTNAAVTVLTPIVRGIATIGSNTVTRRAEAAESVMQAFSYTHVVLTKECLLAVTEPPSFTIVAPLATREPLQLKPDSTNTIPIRVHRAEGVRGAIQIAPARFADGLSIRTAVIPPDKDEGTVMVVATRQAKPDLQDNVILTASLRGGNASGSSTAPAIPVRIVHAPR